MAKFSQFLKSSILSKIVMAVTGLLYIVFVIGHLVGNLQMFIGQDQMNKYAAFLQGLGELLWVVRIVLFGAIFLHILTSIRLNLLNKAARPIDYDNKKAIASTIYSRTMFLSGSTLLAFIIYHLLHFTGGLIQPDAFHHFDSLGRHDVYRMFILGFQNPIIAGSYILAMILLGMHLSHAFQSAFQTLGLSNSKYRAMVRKIGSIIGFVIAGGNILLVVSVLVGIIKLP